MSVVSNVPKMWSLIMMERRQNVQEQPIDFKEDIRVKEGYHLPDAEHFGIWKSKKSASASPLYYVVDWEKKRAVGPISRQRILRAYIQANAEMEAGDPQAWDYGFRVLFKPVPMQGQAQDYERVDPKTLSPSLTLYTWDKNPQINPPVNWGTPSEAAPSAESLNALLGLYGLSWPVERRTVGTLKEGRNFHTRGSWVITPTQKPGDPYAIVDRIENYPDFDLSP
jgi:hypothetical protein